jgi:hypothetical protein
MLIPAEIHGLNLSNPQGVMSVELDRMTVVEEVESRES